MRLPELRAVRYAGLVVIVAACASKPPPYTAAPSPAPQAAPTAPAAQPQQNSPSEASAPVAAPALASPPPQRAVTATEPEAPCEPAQCASDGDAARSGDRARAVEMYRHGCDASDMMSCWRLTQWTRESEERTSARVSACKLGHSTACVDAATAVSPNSKSTARVLTKEAAEFYLLGCNSEQKESVPAAHKGFACVRAGSALILGEGVAVDEKRGVSLFQRACAIDYVDGCFQGGKHLLSGLRFRNDKLRGIKLYDRGCALGDPSSCNNLGVFYDKDLAFRNRRRALDYFLTACDLKDGLACYNASVIAKKPAPWKLRKLACKYGYKKGCR